MLILTESEPVRAVRLYSVLLCTERGIRVPSVNKGFGVYSMNKKGSRQPLSVTRVNAASWLSSCSATSQVPVLAENSFITTDSAATYELPEKTCWMLRNSVVDPWHSGTDPDSSTTDLPIWILLFLQWLTRCQLKKSFFQSFCQFGAHYFLKVHLHQSFKIKSQKEVTVQ